MVPIMKRGQICQMMKHAVRVATVHLGWVHHRAAGRCATASLHDLATKPALPFIHVETGMPDLNEPVRVVAS
jgi:hypothetical protein